MSKIKPKRPVGKPRAFTPEEFEAAWYDYFTWCDNNPWLRNEAIKSGDRVGEIIQIPTARPYTEIGFCSFHDLGLNYIQQLDASIEDKTDEKSLQYSVILSRARAKCYSQKYEGAAVGAFNHNIIARDLGLVDKKDVDLHNKININIT